MTGTILLTLRRAIGPTIGTEIRTHQSDIDGLCIVASLNMESAIRLVEREYSIWSLVEL